MNTFNKVRMVGKKCCVQVQIGDRTFAREAVTQPGEDLS